MLSRKIPKLKLWSRLGLKCKGSSNTRDSIGNTSSNSNIVVAGNTTSFYKAFSIRSREFGKYALQGIPVLSIFALVGMFVFSVVYVGTSSLTLDAYAVSLDEHGCIVGAPAGQEEVWDELTKQCINLTTPNCGAGFAWNAVTKQCYIDSSASLTIGGAGETEQVPAGRGATTYRSHTVRVQASNVSNYGLVITGPSNLTPPSDGTVITGISNKTGTEMDSSNEYDNTWGYGWGDTNTSDSNLTYRTLSPTGTDILTVNSTNDKPALVDRAVDFTKKLVFAVKFSEDATPGRYYTNVTLSLTATPSTLTTYSITYNGNGNTEGTVPAKQSIDLYDTTSYNGFTAAANTGNLTKTGYNFLGWAESSSATTAQYAVGATIPLTQSKPEITLYAVWESNLNWSNITEMQQMTPEICAGASTGATKTLTDTRDGSAYTIGKLTDGKCWMTQNLRIVNRTISSTNSDITSNNFSIPNTSSNFTSSNNNAAYYGNDPIYGAYYSWYTATAGTGTSSIGSGNAASSICPKGWKLPQNGEFGTLNSIYTNWTTENGKNGRWFGAANAATGGSFFPAAGYYTSSSVSNPGNYGRYWSRTASSSNNAYSMTFISGSVNPSRDYAKYTGMPIRCVAYSN